MITPDSLNDLDRKVPAALVLPAGKFFFGFKYTPFDPTKVVKKKDDTSVPAGPTSFSGEGATLKRRPPGSLAPSSNGTPVTPTGAAAVVKEEPDDKFDPWANLGGGNTLRTAKKAVPKTPEVIDATMLGEDDFDFDEGDGGGEYDDVIEIDSD